MRTTKLIATISMILILLLVSSSLQASEKLQIRIWADKSIYLVHEPFIDHYEIQNFGDSSLTLYETFDGLRGKFNIKNENGKDYYSMMIDDYVSRYSNPHFCKNCVTKIKNINW
jgi:hypothetical protein